MSILRVHYRERQRLSAADLRLEQDYRLALGGRHDLAHHDWGIVRGLRLTADGSGGHVLTPGVAVDGHGREIVVAQPLRVDLAGLDQEGRWYILLHYCEDAPRPCPGEPPPRVKPRPVVTVDARFFPPERADPDLARARAAGIDDLAPWPVLVATLGPGGGDAGRLIDYAATRYVRQRAATVRAPNGRAAMRLGLSDRRDFFHFLLSTLNGESRLARRIGIDRDGALHVWRALHISSSTAAAFVRVAKGLDLRLTAPMPAGLGARLWITGQVDGELRTLAASLHAPGASAAARTALKRDSATMMFADGRVGNVSLFDAASGQPVSFANGRRKMRARAGEGMPFAATLEALDARLILKNIPADAAPADDPCDVRRARGGDDEAHASALLFRPVAETQPAPLARAIYAAGAALRITGGEGDDSDAATRASIGAHIGGDYHAAVSMDGARRLDIAAAPGQDPDGALKVQGTVYLPPIGPKDPLLPELLTLAHIGGLRRIGNVTSAVTITLSHSPPLAYRITLAPAPGDGYTVKRTMELIMGADGKGDLTFRTLELPSASDTIPLPATRQAARKLEVTVLMLVEIGDKARVAISNALPFNLDNPP